MIAVRRVRAFQRLARKSFPGALGSPSGDGRQTDRPELDKNFGREDGIFHELPFCS